MFESRIILASTSARRYALLARAGVNASVFAVSINETPGQNEDPYRYVERMAHEKMHAARKQLLSYPLCDELKVSGKVIITADTIGVIDHMPLIKPTSFDHACQMWQKMSDRSHEVITSVCVSVADPDRKSIDQLSVSTQVYFKKLFKEDMQHYWQTCEPLDKAGGYAIQGKGIDWVKKIDGSYSNVVGLPISHTLRLIERATRLTI